MSTNRELKEVELLAKIQARLPNLVSVLEEMSSRSSYEEQIHRFYSGSFKVYRIQEQTRAIMDVLRSIAPTGTQFCSEFTEICRAGASGEEFEITHNEHWTAHTRPMVEAFFHARFFLEMAVKCGEIRGTPSLALASGWAALLRLYGIH